jgi:hypothetical protein
LHSSPEAYRRDPGEEAIIGHKSLTADFSLAGACRRQPRKGREYSETGRGADKRKPGRHGWRHYAVDAQSIGNRERNPRLQFFADEAIDRVGPPPRIAIANVTMPSKRTDSTEARPYQIFTTKKATANSGIMAQAPRLRHNTGQFDRQRSGEKSREQTDNDADCANRFQKIWTGVQRNCSRDANLI